ncbi:Pycsar system effector family protein [Winogradskyella litorisediminis]|uniref:Pycsar system effector family protein n=1 Tax=Winogradskyella litorisediminis TaxID=1156618 RepID=A0ABW3N4D0_9FLAO
MLDIFQKAADYVENFYKSRGVTNLTYHNYHHTLTLLKRANSVFEAENFSPKDSAVVKLALLFSNTGYVTNYENPFEGSAQSLDDFSKIEEIDVATIDKAKDCIKAICYNSPENQLEEITSDIYYSDYGKKSYSKNSLLLKNEISAVSGETLSQENWTDMQIDSFTKHAYYSKFAKLEWESRKRKNLASLLKDQDKLVATGNKEKLKAKYKQKFKNESPERGIQTLYRVALRNHIKLSDIADTKANILLSVNAIIISLVLANLISKLNQPENRFMILPTIVFLVCSVVSMIMSIKATQPNITEANFSQQDLEDRKVNLAFFGNFHQMELEKYQNAFKHLIESREDVYNVLTKDLYFLGAVLSTKYKLLRYTYYVFMAGIVLSIVAFTLSFIYRDTITL